MQHVELGAFEGHFATQTFGGQQLPVGIQEIRKRSPVPPGDQSVTLPAQVGRVEEPVFTRQNKKCITRGANVHVQSILNVTTHVSVGFGECHSRNGRVRKDHRNFGRNWLQQELEADPLAGVRLGENLFEDIQRLTRERRENIAS